MILKTIHYPFYGPFYRHGVYILKAEWTVEMPQDLHVYHSIDVEEELAELLQKCITEEIKKQNG